MYDHVIWPERYDPKTSPIYALNDIDVRAPSEVIWGSRTQLPPPGTSKRAGGWQGRGECGRRAWRASFTAGALAASLMHRCCSAPPLCELSETIEKRRLIPSRNPIPDYPAPNRFYDPSLPLDRAGWL